MPMKLGTRYRWLIVVGGLMALALVALIEPTGIVRGWLRGEVFYDGRPTNYWSRELACWQYGGVFWADFDGDRWPDLFVANQDDLRAGVEGGVVLRDVGGPDGCRVIDIDFDGHGAYFRRPGMLHKVIGFFGMKLDGGDPPAVLTGDPAAEAVVRELLDDDNQGVRDHAKRGLRAIARRKVEGRESP